MLAPVALLIAAQAGDAPMTLRYELGATEVTQGDTVQLDVVLTVRSQQQVEELALPEFPRGLTVLQERRASSTQIGKVNGKRAVTVEQRYVYILRADDAGTHRIGEATARMGKAVARAAPVVIKVVSAGEDVDDDAASPGATPGARFGKDLPAAFLEVTIDKAEVFVGEQLTVTTEVFTQQPLSQWPRLAPMKPPGFLCVPLLGDDRPAPKQRTIKGRTYTVYLVNKDALFPTAPGDKSLPALDVDLVPAGSFFSRGRDVNVKSPKLAVKVKALPDVDKPAKFSAGGVSGNVGNFQLNASVRPTTATLGQPFTLSLTATGNGNLDQIAMPTWEGGENARVFPATIKIERRSTDEVESLIGGRVVAEMLVQPQREGELRIPSFTLAMFDPQSGTYKESTTASIVVPVKPAKGAGSATGGTTSTSGGRQTIARGARPLRTKITAESAIGNAPVFAAGAVFIAGLATLAVGSLRRRQRGSVEGKRAERARQIKGTLDEATKRGDLALLERAVLDALEERFGSGVKATSTADLGTLLAARGAHAGLVDDVVGFIRDVEAARYGGAGERQRLATMASALLDRVGVGHA